MSEDDDWTEIKRVLRKSSSTAPVCLLLMMRRNIICPRLIFRAAARDHIRQYGPRFKMEVAKDHHRLRITEDNKTGSFELSNQKHTSSLFLPAIDVWTKPTTRAVDCEWVIAGTARGIIVTIPREQLLASQAGQPLMLPPAKPKNPPPVEPVLTGRIQILEEDPDAVAYSPIQLGMLEQIPLQWPSGNLNAIQRLLVYALCNRKDVSLTAARLITKIGEQDLVDESLNWHFENLRDALIVYGAVLNKNRAGAYHLARNAQIALCKQFNIQPPEV